MMKKYLYLLVAVMLLNITSKAAPGDTTWVQANNTQLQGFGSYDDSVVVFPPAGKTYSRILMIFTLGKYVCPGSPTYCGDWDYTILNYIIKPDGTNLELSRLISPYANAGAPRTPFTWQQHYVYDVTDYASVLRDTSLIRIFYSGYTGGFTGNIKFAFVEGAPDREVLGIHRLWTGSYGYGGGTSINTHFQPVTDTAPEFTKSAELKFTVTGHGSDNNNCNEFCSHSYFVYFNGGVVDSYTIWRSNCGMNELYPQSGTWLLERANWCPGALVNSEHHVLPGFVAGMHASVGLQFDAYSGSGGASYTTEGQLFFYGSMKKTLDASIDDIIAPTNNENHFRENPTSGNPIVHVKNRGTATINTITFQYGVSDTLSQTYNWTGTLKSLEETDVVLPALGKLESISGDTGTFKFTAKIVTVNSMADADSTNNRMISYFNAAPLWPSSFEIKFLTNNQELVSEPGICETSWAIYDMNNNVVAKRDSAKISKIYLDTISLNTGFYKLVIVDSGCDGLQWWPYAGTGVSAGYMSVRKLYAPPKDTAIPMNGYNYSGLYNNDFGCGFTQYFSVSTPAKAGVTDVTAGYGFMEAYPNPAKGLVTVNISGLTEVKGVLHLVDALGRVVAETPCNSSNQQINLEGLSGGVYTIVFINETSGNKLTTRLLIVR